ncbi:MAG: hypothetical protein WC389_17935 [Lutibacter sp.]|jgi:asparagine synthetase B (glutamine-hydrolysing)
MVYYEKKLPHPKWATMYRKPGTELRCINGKYYLYEISSKYDKALKRSKKITGKLLGKITPEGFIESDKHKLRKGLNKSLTTPLQVKEYGASYTVTKLFEEKDSKIKTILWRYLARYNFLSNYQVNVSITGKKHRTLF